MTDIWVYSEDGVIAKQLLTLGRELANTLQSQLWAVTLTYDESSDLIALGADRVIVLQGNSLYPEGYAHTLAKLAADKKPYTVLIGATQRGKDVAATVAALLQAGLVTEASAVRLAEGLIETDRMMYGGLAVCTEVISQPALITIPPKAYEMPALDYSRQGEIVAVKVTPDERVSVSHVCPIMRTGADISVAERVVCVGRGLAGQEDLRSAEKLAAALGAEIGCTRSIAEDYHWLPSERYIGLSGQRIKPSLYLSLGVSGQVQHVVGIRDSKIIIAVDMNEKAPIFEAADYGIVGDLSEVTPLLIDAIQKGG